jgi:hypothetical protein
VTSSFRQVDSVGLEDRQPITSLRAIANRCTAGSCPTIYQADADTGSVVVQGFTVHAQRSGIEIPEGVALVEIPVELLTEAMRHLS